MSPHSKPDLSDPMQMAVKVTAVEGTLALLQQQVSAGLGNVSSQLSSLQGELREVSKVTSEVARHQQAMESHSEGLNRAFGAIERYANEFAGWRERHESENKGVSNSVTTFRGVLIGFGVLASLVVAGVVWVVSEGFQREAEERAKLEAKHDIDVSKLERRTDVLGADVRELRETRGLK